MCLVGWATQLELCFPSLNHPLQLKSGFYPRTMFQHQREKGKDDTSNRSTACHAIPPDVAKSIQEIPRAPSVSNLPCPIKEMKQKFNDDSETLVELLKQLDRQILQLRFGQRHCNVVYSRTNEARTTNINSINTWNIVWG